MSSRGNKDYSWITESLLQDFSTSDLRLLHGYLKTGSQILQDYLIDTWRIFYDYFKGIKILFSAEISLKLNFNEGWHSVILTWFQQANQTPTLKAGQAAD